MAAHLGPVQSWYYATWVARSDLRAHRSGYGGGGGAVPLSYYLSCGIMLVYTALLTGGVLLLSLNFTTKDVLVVLTRYDERGGHAPVHT